MKKSPIPFPEDFLHFLWKYRLFDSLTLKTVSGEPLAILSTGYHNKDSGPDFNQAEIRIGDTLWVGSVEIHLNSSDWYKHYHSDDRAYDNVILHVVYLHDTEITRPDGTDIQTLELVNRIPAERVSKYQGLMENINWIPCQKQLPDVDDLFIESWLSRVLIERLEEKSKTLNDLLNEFKGSWDNAFYVMLARNFGFKVNALPFELLAKSLPQQLLAKHKNSPLQIEALIFGQAGFLDQKPADHYPRMLYTEYRFLKKKYQLKPLDKYIWKFSRMRPQNFPTSRLAQFSALILKSSHLFSKVINVVHHADFREMFTNLPVNTYWETHYRFDSGADERSPQPGTDSVNNLIMNTISVFLYCYGRYTGSHDYIARAVSLLESLPPEDNAITRSFLESGLIIKKADRSQALLQLKKYYCDQKKCLNCGIGIQVLNL